MKPFFLLLVAASLIPHHLSAQSAVTFSPAKPKAGSIVAFRYDPSGTPLEGKEAIEATAYLLVGGKPIAQEIKLSKSGKVYKGQIKTSDTTRAFYISFSKDGVKDNNNDSGYYSYIYNAAGKPVPEARKAAGLEVYSYGEMWGLKMTFAQSLALIKADFAENPSLRDKFLMPYLLNLMQSRAEDDRQVVRKELPELEAPDALEKNLKIAKYVYTYWQEKDNLNRVDSIIKVKYPKGEFARIALYNGFRSLKTTEEQAASYHKLLTDFVVPPEENSQLDNMAYGIAYSYVVEKKYDKVKEYLNQIKDPSIKASACNEIAWKLSGAGVYNTPIDAALGKEYSSMSLDLVNDFIKKGINKPSYYTNKQWADINQKNYYMFADTYALLCYQLKDYQTAFDYEEKAIKYNEGSDIGMNESYAVYVEKIKGAAAAEKELEIFIRKGKATTNMHGQYKRLYLAGNKSEEQFTAHIKELQEDVRSFALAELAKQMVKNPAPAFALQDLNGKEVTLASLKGKIVIVDFWATWCGPCVASFPGMKMAMEKFKNDPDVQFVYVDTRETGDKEKVKKAVSTFIEKNAYPFQVLMDYDSKVIDQYKVEGIPTKFIIDKNNMIRFVKAGFDGSAEKIVEEITSMVELAKAGS